MKEKSRIRAELLMLDFAIRTGIGSDQRPERRYLWTDAFAVFNFLSLYRMTSDDKHLRHAGRLIDLVHHTLGRHHPEDVRTGWLSGLGEDEGREHPTVNGLRIGKPLVERPPDDPFDMRLEWERDGQYFHYLTKWMHALDCMYKVTGESDYLRWALELADAAAKGFIRKTPDEESVIYWKMSVDLTRPLVSSMGQLDALDGYCIYQQLLADADETGILNDLRSAATEMKDMCRRMSWFTDDELGIGGTLSSGAELINLIAAGDIEQTWLCEKILRDSAGSLERYGWHNALGRSAESRLAFREFGLAIGLRAVEPLADRIESEPGRFSDPKALLEQLGSINRHQEVAERIVRFWIDEKNQSARTWTDHHDINEVMLATALIDPEELLYTPARIESARARPTTREDTEDD